MNNINLINLLSPDFTDKTLALINSRNLNGIYKSCTNIRSYVLNLIERNTYNFNMLLYFLEKYPNKSWNWKYIGRNLNLTIEFIENNPDLPWDEKDIFKRSGIKLETENHRTYKFNKRKYWNMSPIVKINEIKDYKDYNYISENHDLTIDFIKDNIDEEWDWYKISKNPGIKMEDIQNNLKLPWVWSQISRNPNLRIDFIKNNTNNLLRCPKTTFLQSCDWTAISRNRGIKMEDIQNNPNLPWDFTLSGVVKNPNLTIDFVKLNSDKYWLWFAVSENVSINDIINNPDERWEWDYISKSRKITMFDIENNSNLPWNWNFVSLNPNLTVGFYSKYINILYKTFPNSTGNWNFENISKNNFGVI